MLAVEKDVRGDEDRIGDQPQRSEEHTSELQSRFDLVCRLLLEKKNDVGKSLRSVPAGGFLLSLAQWCVAGVAVDSIFIFRVLLSHLDGATGRHRYYAARRISLG